jgi:1-acyl-sn-glycerol-3-phosphate acyltransferase
VSDGPQGEGRRSGERHGPWFRFLGLPLSRLIATILLALLGPTRVHGRRQIPRRGGLLILANHISDIDPILVQYGCPRPIHFMAKSELFEMPLIGSLARAFRAFPVKRGEPDRPSIRRAASLVQAGEVVCIFPEGEESPTGELLPLKPGIALIVRMAGGRVLCAGIRGANRMMPYGARVPRPAFGWITLQWGRPRHFDRDASQEEILGWVEDELRRLSGENRVQEG